MRVHAQGSVHAMTVAVLAIPFAGASLPIRRWDVRRRLHQQEWHAWLTPVVRTSVHRPWRSLRQLAGWPR